MIKILAPGMYATVQDLGRVGYGHLGVPRSGGADPLSLELGNRIVGNPAGAAGVEFLMGEFEVGFLTDSSFALTGAPVNTLLDARPVGNNVWTYARRGQRLKAGRPPFGLWTYLTIAGGVDVEPVLSSRSTDSLSGIGPRALAVGDELPVGAHKGPPSTPVDVVRETCQPLPCVDVQVRWGPRHDWFTESSRRLFREVEWEISAEINRIAARLNGPRLEYISARQLPTEGMALGSVQVPPSGQPIVFLANHPPTGGYPVLGVVRSADVARVAQSRPGTRLRMHPVR